MRKKKTVLSAMASENAEQQKRLQQDHGRKAVASPFILSDMWSRGRGQNRDSAHWLSPGSFSGAGPESWFEDRVTNVDEQADHSNRACLLSRPALVCARVAVLAAVVTVLALRHMRPSNGDPKDGRICRSAGCAAMDALLAASVNQSGDPCHDFTAYVCSGRWRGGTSQPPEATAVAVLQQAWARRLYHLLEEQASSGRIIRKAANMFLACLSRGSHDISSRSVELLRQFLKDRRVTWPEEPGAGVEPLDLFLDCAINWGIPLWLRVRLMRYRENSPRQVSMDPVARPPPFFEVSDSAMFGEMWLRYFDLLSSRTPTTSKPPAESARRRIEGTFRIQTRVVESLFATDARRSITGAEPAVSQAFTFAQIANKTATFTEERLEVILNKHFRMIYPLVGTDVLVTSDVAYLEKAFEIFAEFSKDVMLDALGWWLVVSSGVYVPPSQRFDYAQNLECAVLADDVYKLLLAAERSATLFTEADRDGLQEFATRTVRSALETSLQGLTSDRYKREDKAEMPGSSGASLLSRNVRVKLWPDAKYIAEERLQSYFGRFPEGDKDFYLEQWIYAKRNASGLFSKYVYDELSRLPHFYYDPPIAYDLPHNTIVVSPAALSEPLYFANGTDAMLYGSLGSALATKAASLVACNRGKPIAACGYPAIFDSTAAWRYVHQGQKGRLATCDQTGLEVSYGLYVNASTKSSSTVLESFPNHSPKQLFFMVWCYTKCFDSGFRANGNVCDKGVADMEAFYKVFDCENNTF